MNPRKSRGPSLKRRGLRAISATVAALLAATTGTALGVTAANAATNAAITLLPHANATTPHSQYDPFSYTFDWACSSGGEVETCNDMQIVVPITLEPRAGQAELLHTWTFNVETPAGSSVALTPTYQRGPTTTTVTLTADAPIPAGTQETFVLQVRPAQHVGDQVRFTVGEAELTTSNVATARSGSYTSEVINNPLRDPSLTVASGYRNSAGNTLVTYSFIPHMAYLMTPTGTYYQLINGQTPGAVYPNVTAFRNSLDIVLALPAGVTASNLGDGIVYDAATHSLRFVGNNLPQMLSGTSFNFVLEYPSSMNGQTVTLDGLRNFTATNGDDWSTPFSVTHTLDYEDIPVGVVGKCGAGSYNSNSPRASGTCSRAVALPQGWVRPSSDPYILSQGSTATYQISVDRVTAGDEIRIRDFLPCLDNQTQTTPVPAYFSQDTCATPTLDIRSISYQMSPDGSLNWQTLYDGEYTVFNSDGSVTETRTALNAPIPDRTGGVWHGVEVVIPSAPISGTLRMSITVHLQPDVDHDLLLHNQAHVEQTHRGDNAPALSGESPIGTIRVADEVAGTAYSTINAMNTSGSATVVHEFEVRNLNPATGLPVYVMELPLGWELLPGSNWYSSNNRPGTPAIADMFDVTVVPEDLSTNSPARYIFKTKPGAAADALPGSGYPAMRFSASIVPTWASPYVSTSTRGWTSVDGSGNTVDSCTRGTYTVNDPTDWDQDGVIGTDPSCVSTAARVPATPGAAASGVAQKSVRDMESGSWVTGNARANIMSDQMEYRISWVNAGQPSLSDVVLYDVFPYPGDTGTTWLTETNPRGSTYQPTFAGLTSSIPPGMEVAYSASTNPCRPEVLPTNPGCDNDWTADPATIGGDENVRAIRIVLPGAQPTGRSYALTFAMNVPEAARTTDVAWNTVAHRSILNGTPMNPAETARTGALLPAAVNVEKTLDESSAGNHSFQVGDTLTYRLTAVNQYGTGLEHVVLEDDLTDVLRSATFNNDATASSGSVTFDAATNTLRWEGDLNPSEAVTITYTVTATDIDGEVVNAVVGTSNEDGTNCVDGTEDGCTTTGTIIGTPAVSIVKTARNLEEGTAIDPGTEVRWNYTVTNTGTDTLTNIQVVDNRNVSVTCPTTTLEPGESMTCQGRGYVWGPNSYTNRGTVTADGETTGRTVTASDDWTTPVNSWVPSLSLEKVSQNVAEGETLEPGTVVTWNYIVTNTGNDGFQNVYVTDNRGVPVTCPNPVNLLAGESVTCTGSGSVGYGPTYTNVGTVNGTGYYSGISVQAQDDWSTPVRQLGSGITIDKVATDVEEGSTVRPGTVVTWQYIVTNTGEQPIGKIRVTDDQGVEVNCPAIEELGVGESMTCTGSGSVGEGESYTNVATVTGTTVITGEPLSEDDSWTVNVEAATPALSIVKGSSTATDGGSVMAGTEVTWNYTVTNTGTERIVNLAVTDDQGVEVACPVSELGVGETVTCTGTAIIGNVTSYTNVGTATGEGEESGDPAESSDEWTTDVETPTTIVGLTKSSPDYEYGSELDPDTQVTWEYTVTNHGSETLLNITVTDDQGVEVTCPSTTLAPGETMVCTGAGSVGTGASYTNIGTATAVGEITGTPTTSDDSWTVTLIPPITPVDGEPGDPTDSPEWPNVPAGGTPTAHTSSKALAITGATGLGMIGAAGASILILGLVLMLAQRRKVES